MTSNERLEPRPRAAVPGVVPPGGAIGVIGGGQLGRMLAFAAGRLGIKTHVYSPELDPPAASAAATLVRGSDDFHRNMERFAAACDVVTYESENTPLTAVDQSTRFAPVRPGRRALEVSQDRLFEKSFLREIGVETTAFAPIDGLADLRSALLSIGGVGVLKTRRMGYDGKGQAWVRADGPDGVEGAARAAYQAIGRAPAILEAPAKFRREISIIAARGLDGDVACYDPSVNVHEGGVLRRSVVDGSIPVDVAAAAQSVARRILNALEYVGVLGVEFFEMPNGRLLVNEIAPRVHNSGHWTEDACAVGQFEQHVRAICGWPLAATDRHSDAEMTNVLGDEVLEWRSLSDAAGVALQLYGKAEIRPGRKMGHYTRLRERRRD